MTIGPLRASSIEPNNSKLEGPKCLDCYLRASRHSPPPLPIRFGYAVANSLARAHLWFFPQRRHAALVNLATIMPGSSRRERMRIVLKMMASYNCMLFEFFRLPRLERDELLRTVDVDGHQHVLDALARGKGVIITSSHIGNWELGAVVLAHLGHQVHAVAGVQLGRWLAPRGARCKERTRGAHDQARGRLSQTVARAVAQRPARVDGRWRHLRTGRGVAVLRAQGALAGRARRVVEAHRRAGRQRLLPAPRRAAVSASCSNRCSTRNRSTAQMR